ncbi:uncharacterized protein LOC129597542 [Paramacrobiotus metropolitanus]|uniref:uncharacterized protein LOC129597542 n=1 Tax=Paramacrobiotus metropolitanus TaxID=2943436 RepID=UPI0024459207|nr:uncharacterized protein LOC129597542 [Paramacrobiotus metropolitanus]
MFRRTFPTCIRTAALELHSNAHRLPLCYSLLNFIAGLAFLLLILSSGSTINYNHALSFVAVVILCGTGLLQVVFFSYLYLKSVSPDSPLPVLMSALRAVRPFLITAFAIPALMMLMFIMLVTVCAVDIITARSHADTRQRNLLPDYYNVGMGAAIVVFQVFPMLVHHDLLMQINLLRKSFENSGGNPVVAPPERVLDVDRLESNSPAPVPPPPYHFYYWDPLGKGTGETAFGGVNAQMKQPADGRIDGPPPVYESWL